jgi:Ca2+-transporting ATPase
MRTIREVVEQLGVDLDKGLTPAAAALSARRFGINSLTALPRPSIWSRFLEKFNEPIIKILLVAALLSMIVELFRAERALGGLGLSIVALAAVVTIVARQRERLPAVLFGSALALALLGLASGHLPIEGLAVMAAVMLATGVAFASEYRSDREFEVLNAQRKSFTAKVTRGGEVQTVATQDIVVGDVVLLEVGDEVPADGWVIKATALTIDQSLMTGESEPVLKVAEDATEAGTVFRGTQVIDGNGQMLVTEVGDATALGQIARELSADDTRSTAEQRVQRKLAFSKELTPLQRKLEKLARLISKVGYTAAGLIFAAQLLRGLLLGIIFWPASTDDLLAVLGVLLNYFVNMVIIIVVAVPEGLPMSVTVSLALAMRKMTRANALVRQLVACETVGSATVICTDKTGTLTQNRMEVARLCWDGHTMDRGHPEWATLLSRHPLGSSGAVDWFILNAAINSTANLMQENGKLVPVGNSTEAALLQWLQEIGIAYHKLRLQFPALYQVHFSSDRKRMTTVVRRGEELVKLVKGSPERLLEHSTRYESSTGGLLPLTAQARSAFELQLREAAAQAMRTLAFGYAVLGPAQLMDGADLDAASESEERDLVFAGFVGIRDPLREDVPEALARCRSAGIQVKMVTGDNIETARAIGAAAGLLEPDETRFPALMTSQEFNTRSDDELKQQLSALRILARAKPLDKLRLVKLLQQLGEVVAVTGDGTNDAPALKQADVGLAMGRAGTEVAKEASKIVLLDDSFATIVRAVHWGRSLYENIQRFVQFQLTVNVSALATYLLATLFFQVEAPFTVLQLLWINVIMDTFAAIALCSEPPRPGVMKVPPRKRDENIVTPAMARTIFTTAIFMVAAMLTLLGTMKGTPAAPGWLGDSAGPWSVEVDGTRTDVAGADLVQRDGAWTIREHSADPALASLAGHQVEPAFTVLQATLFFSAYVFLQFWNQVNCRSLSPRVSGLRELGKNPTFLAIAAATAIGQIIIVSAGGSIFKVQPLGLGYWVAIALGTASVLVFGEIVRWIQRVPKKGTGLICAKHP